MGRYSTRILIGSQNIPIVVSDDVGLRDFPQAKIFVLVVFVVAVVWIRYIVVLHFVFHEYDRKKLLDSDIGIDNSKKLGSSYVLFHSHELLDACFRSSERNIRSMCPVCVVGMGS